MKPLTLLLLLVGTAISLSGWGYAWKTRATPFSKQEEIMFDLQDQIEVLEEENATLHARIEELSKIDE